MRLDFQNFVITGPAIDQTARLKTIGGVQIIDTLAANKGKDVTLQTQCLTDTFQVVGGGGVSNSDVICGTNTNEHCEI